jgi:alkylated DNA nucleotide flippase Atl1
MIGEFKVGQVATYDQVSAHAGLLWRQVSSVSSPLLFDPLIRLKL